MNKSDTEFWLFHPDLSSKYSKDHVGLRKDSIGRFGKGADCSLEQWSMLPDRVEAFGNGMPSELYLEWKRAVATEIWFASHHHPTQKVREYLRACKSLDAIFDAPPLVSNPRIPLRIAIEYPMTAAAFPLASNDGGSPEIALIIFGKTGTGGSRSEWGRPYKDDYRWSFVSSSEKSIVGDSYGLALALAETASKSGDSRHARELARKFILSGSYNPDGGSIGTVKTGNKPNLKTKRRWLVNWEDTAKLQDVRLFQRVSSVQDAWSRVTGSGTLPGENLRFKHVNCHTLVSLTSIATPVILGSLILSRPQRFLLLYTNGSKKDKATVLHALNSLRKDHGDLFHDSMEICKPVLIPSDNLMTIQEAVSEQLEHIVHAPVGSQHIFQITNGNFLMRLGAYNVIKRRTDFLAIYRDGDSKDRIEFTALQFPDADLPTTSKISGESCEGYDIGKLLNHRSNNAITSEDLITQLVSQ